MDCVPVDDVHGDRSEVDCVTVDVLEMDQKWTVFDVMDMDQKWTVLQLTSMEMDQKWTVLLQLTSWRWIRSGLCCS